MKKLLTVLLVAFATLTSCTKDEMEEPCATLVNIRVEDQTPPRTKHYVPRSQVFIVFTYSNGNEYNVVRAGNDYSHFSDLDECEYLEAKPY